jgi:hypothetical protein
MARATASFETVDFACAAPGRRIQVINWVLIATLVVFLGFNLWLATTLPAPKFWPVVLAPLVGVPIVVGTAWLVRIKTYRMTADELQVIRGWTTSRYALAGLVRVETGSAVLQGMRKRMGNDGLGAITGEFRSKRLGDFEIYATDTAKAVVLHWPQDRLVISPEHTNRFMEAVAARTGCRMG